MGKFYEISGFHYLNSYGVDNDIFLLIASIFRGCSCDPEIRLRFNSMTNNAQKLWSASLGQLQLEVPRPSYETWLKDTMGLSIDGDLLSIGTPTTFASEWLGQRMHQVIEDVVSDVAGRPIRVAIKVVSSHLESGPAEGGAMEAPIPVQPMWNSDPALSGPVRNYNGNGRYTFNNFITGVSNHLAYAAARAVSDKPGVQYNPLFIYAGVGLGKTHLLHAIASSVSEQGVTPLYVTTEQFTNDFVQSIRQRRTEEFRAKYRSAEFLLLDDVQFLSGKEQTQEGLFHTFNDLHNANRQIVVACDQPPTSVSLLEDRLRSRFEWGLIADIQEPDLETRVAILLHKAQAQNAPITEEAAFEIARRAPNGIRSLEGCLNRIIALSQFFGSPISTELIDMALSGMPSAGSEKKLSPDVILESVSNYYQVPTKLICTRTRDRKTTHPQRVTMFLLDAAIKKPIREIASLMGNWNPKTVRNSIRQINDALAREPSIANDVASIRSNLGLVDNSRSV